MARIARLLLHLLRGLAIARFGFPRWTAVCRREAIRGWSAELPSKVAIAVAVHGSPPASSHAPVMLVANHVSWLDIFGINAVLPVRFVAKSEVRRWPLIGWLCERAGTVFIRQARRHDTLRVNEAISAALAAGDVFAVFPEGTTTDGSAVIKFHSSLLEPALRARASMQPVALRYTRPDGSLCDEVSYAGARTLWDTVRDMTTVPAITLEIFFLPPITGDFAHRREIARAAEDAIRQALGR